jgi:hypothetical protein
MAPREALAAPQSAARQISKPLTSAGTDTSRPPGFEHERVERPAFLLYRALLAFAFADVNS